MPIDGLEVVLVRAHDRRARVLDDVGELVRAQPVVDRHEDRADLRHGVKRLELRVRVRRDVGDAIARLDAERLQRGGPPVAAIEELRVGKPQVAVDDRFAIGVQRAGRGGQTREE